MPTALHIAAAVLSCIGAIIHLLNLVFVLLYFEVNEHHASFSNVSTHKKQQRRKLAKLFALLGCFVLIVALSGLIAVKTPIVFGYEKYIAGILLFFQFVSSVAVFSKHSGKNKRYLYLGFVTWIFVAAISLVSLLTLALYLTNDDTNQTGSVG